MLRVYGCVFSSVSLLYVYMRMPSGPRSVAEMPSSRALPGFPGTAPPPVFFPSFLFALTVWRQTQEKNSDDVTGALPA